MKRVLLFFALISCICAARGADKQTPQKPLVVHEWGTFTSLQDEQGNAIGGINTDDEPVPSFVHRLHDNLLLQVTPSADLYFSMDYQGAPASHPDVTMRLETPVMYFYPPKGWKSQPVDVRVAFVGGWLTEFYPAAEAKAPGLDSQNPDRVYPEQWDPAKEPHSDVGYLTDDTRGELFWKGLTLNAPGTGPRTQAKVWLAPRAVKSSMVKNDINESERFLFYRGVAHADASLRVLRDKPTGMLEIHDNRFHLFNSDAERAQACDMYRITGAWLLDVRPGGACAFRSLGTLEFGKETLATIPASFGPDQYSAKNMTLLRAEMQTALAKAGLFTDEADALLNTWQVSYFKSSRLRLFYICPRRETDERLPLQLYVTADVTRVMIGRIELVTPEQRALLAKIAAGPAPDMSAARAAIGKSGSEFFTRPENVANWEDAITGKKPFSALGMEIPELYVDYLKLGRFRNALVLNEQDLRPTPALNDFISKNQLEAYRIADSGPPNQSNTSQPSNQQTNP